MPNHYRIQLSFDIVVFLEAKVIALITIFTRFMISCWPDVDVDNMETILRVIAHGFERRELRKVCQTLQFGVE